MYIGSPDNDTKMVKVRSYSGDRDTILDIGELFDPKYMSYTLVTSFHWITDGSVSKNDIDMTIEMK